MQKNMTPNQIKIALRKRDISQSGLARDLGCSPQHIFLVIKDPTRSFPAACHIATALKKTVDEIWPETFTPNQEPPRVGRPMSKGLYDHHAA
ncbi:MAG: helix-turn-helix domain-containing protein [Desulfobacterales bacterium]|nr:helix-turn-helix domain-containing protein [Desulfobacterales bacterium]